MGIKPTTYWSPSPTRYRYACILQLKLNFVYTTCRVYCLGWIHKRMRCSPLLPILFSFRVRKSPNSCGSQSKSAYATPLPPTIASCGRYFNRCIWYTPLTLSATLRALCLNATSPVTSHRMYFTQLQWLLFDLCFPSVTCRHVKVTS